MTDEKKITSLELQDYDLRLDYLCNNINEKGYKKIMLQFSEGLKKWATEIKDTIEKKTEAKVLISADSCYGACDFPLFVEHLDIDLIVQFGHSEIPNLKSSVPIVYIEAFSKLDIRSVVEKAIKNLKGTVGLITTAQHVHKLDEAKKIIESKGLKAEIGRGSGRIAHNGQVLGCNLSSATSISNHVDCYLFIGSGNFHAVGVAMATDKPVVIADPYLNEVREIEKIMERLMRQRHGAITKAGNAQSFGILVGTKPGQKRTNLAFELKELIEKHDLKAYIFLLNEFTPMNLRTFEIDAYVSTACPRIAIDDYLMYHVPILTPIELKIALGEANWEDYRFDEFI